MYEILTQLLLCGWIKYNSSFGNHSCVVEKDRKVGSGARVGGRSKIEELGRRYPA